MKLSDFPRPPQDNGRGIHWSARIYHPTGRDLTFWIHELTAMHMKWIKLLDDGDGSSLELCRRLLDAGMMPVVRLYRERPNPGRMGGRELSGVRKLVAAGVRYFESNNELDLSTQWQENHEWQDNHKPENWLDTVADNFIYDADMILNEGGLPAVPAMGPGGSPEIIARVVEKGRADLFEKGAWLAIHNYTLNHPINYPADRVNQEGQPLTQSEFDAFPDWAWGGRSREMINERRAQDKNPGHTLDDDANCFRGWELAGKRMHDLLSYHIPVISTEGGAVVGWGDDLRYPKVTPDQQAEMQIEIIRFLQEKAPPWYFSCCTWLLASRPLGDWNPTWEQMSWYTDAWNEQFGLAGQLPVVQRMKDLPTRTRAELRQGSGLLTVTVQRADTRAPVGDVPVEIESVKSESVRNESITGGPARRFTVTTDAQGRCVIDRLPAGTYRLLVFNAEQGRVTLRKDDSKAITLAVSTGRRSQIEGRVLDANGAPQADQLVTLHQISPPRLLAETVSDADGRYRFSDLPAVKSVVRVAPGTERSVERSGLALDGWQRVAADVTVPRAPARRYQVITQRLRTPEETGNNNTIIGQVLDESGTPQDGVTVRLRWTGASPETNFPVVKSGQDPFKPRGYFEFIHTPGVFIVDLLHDEFESEVADNLVTANMPNRSRPISYEVVFQLNSTAAPNNHSEIGGRVQGGPPNLAVTLSGGGMAPKVARLDSSGGFRFGDLAAGIYQVSLEGVGAIAQNVTLNGVNSHTVDFPMLGEIKGRVLPGNQAATVVLTCDRYSIRQEDETDGQGQYEFTNLPDDGYTLRLKDGDLPAQEVVCDGRSVVNGPTFDRAQQQMGEISGRVTDHQGSGVANRLIWARTLGKRVAEAQTSAQGQFRLQGLSTGVYSLELDGHGLVAQTVRVDGSSTITQNVQLPAPADGVIAGQVLSARSVPVANRMVTISAPGIQPVNSDTDGTFRFQGLTEGSYAVSIADVPRVSQTVRVSGSGTTEITLNLPPLPEEARRPLSHYLYLSSHDPTMTQAQIRKAIGFIRKHSATVGFDAQSCLKAERVTIVGEVPGDLIGALEQQGISYHRVPGTVSELETELEKLP